MRYNFAFSHMSSLNMLFNVILRHKHKACRLEKSKLHTSLLPQMSFKICREGYHGNDGLAKEY